MSSKDSPKRENDYLSTLVCSTESKGNDSHTSDHIGDTTADVDATSPASQIKEGSQLESKPLWFVGMEYTSVPGPLNPIDDNASQRWYAIIQGIRVGVFLDAASVTDVTSGVPNVSMVMRKFQAHVILLFNNALASGKVCVLCPKPSSRTVPSMIIIASDSDEGVFDTMYKFQTLIAN
ncbi:hypothetical protein EV421DRAFT_1913628 [Armillaria borealis]|uniref:Uncharacterized protein n=1 Tax=Armillaria borealis TaxID=47425 RepID=A0AA39IU82_9AGAR|nr:hypothetical protein EV421DRAFT_1913628 [Armillaria borealis]